MTAKEVSFDNAREAMDVLGPRGETLASLERLWGVKAVARDLWLKIGGAAEASKGALAGVEALLRARNAGMRLNSGLNGYLLEAVAQGKGAEVDGLLKLRVDVAPGRPPVFPRTFGQARYLRAIRERTLVFGVGPAGTGKTWLAMAAAVEALLKQDVSRIVLTRPAVEAGEALGFLPGDLQQKVSPYLRPLHDALHEMLPPEQAAELTGRGAVEVAPLAYMRGRTLNRAFVILDEAQNTTREQMLMFLTRIGFDSKVVVNGDLTQVDLPNRKASGLEEAVRLVEGTEDTEVVRLGAGDVVRHPLVARIIEAYRRGREEESRARGRGRGASGDSADSAEDRP
ncbi:MAG: PhoH family protein [Kiritimatiellae bacterium]|nr:PhoH family protein [Kiritimatiellia bacterium]